MTSPFPAKLIVSVVTLLCLIHFSSVCNAMRMLGEENYQGKGTENDNIFKEEKDSTLASPNIGGSPFTFNIPPFSLPFNIPNIPGFGSPGVGGLPGFGSPGSPGAGARDNNPFTLPMPGVPDVVVQPPTVTP
ncbi:hypothetical protein RND71_033847 [Anisodus tanguticus]|uniref:Transmembrane protein n=1 Tax=Anisodus tanguticus TaxID=243964 RepID=A0AAE1RA81_9SOLA|nr:hypothetical protein RND71_033847 [Anisodus tanguticus]